MTEKSQNKVRTLTLGHPVVAGKSIAGNREVIYWEVIYRELGRSFPGIGKSGIGKSQKFIFREPGSQIPGSGLPTTFHRSLTDSQPVSHGIWPIYI